MICYFSIGSKMDVILKRNACISVFVCDVRCVTHHSSFNGHQSICFHTHLFFALLSFLWSVLWIFDTTWYIYTLCIIYYYTFNMLWVFFFCCSRPIRNEPSINQIELDGSFNIIKLGQLSHSNGNAILQYCSELYSNHTPALGAFLVHCITYRFWEVALRSTFVIKIALTVMLWACLMFNIFIIFNSFFDIYVSLCRSRSIFYLQRVWCRIMSNNLD